MEQFFVQSVYIERDTSSVRGQEDHELFERCK